jgi:hypothetical protein
MGYGARCDAMAFLDLPTQQTDSVTRH